MKKFISNKRVLFFFGIVIVFFLWEILSLIIDTNSMVFPSPKDTLVEMFNLLGKKSTYVALLNSFARMIMGFTFAFIIAFILGMFVNVSSRRYELMKPLMIVLKAIPTATIVFVFIVLSGAKNAPIYVVSLVSLPILYEAIVGGLKSAKKDAIEAAQVDGASNIKTLFSIRLPAATPMILVGIASSFSLSFKIEIMAEVLSGYTKNGIGSFIRGVQQSDPTNLIPVFAYSLFAIIFMVLFTMSASQIKDVVNKRQLNLAK